MLICCFHFSWVWCSLWTKTGLMIHHSQRPTESPQTESCLLSLTEDVLWKNFLQWTQDFGFPPTPFFFFLIWHSQNLVASMHAAKGKIIKHCKNLYSRVADIYSSKNPKARIEYWRGAIFCWQVLKLRSLVNYFSKPSCIIITASKKSWNSMSAWYLSQTEQINISRARKE